MVALVDSSSHMKESLFDRTLLASVQGMILYAACVSGFVCVCVVFRDEIRVIVYLCACVCLMRALTP